MVLPRSNPWKLYSAFHRCWENKNYLCPSFPCHSQFCQRNSPSWVNCSLCGSHSSPWSSLLPFSGPLPGIPLCRAFMSKQNRAGLSTDPSVTSLATSLHSLQDFVSYFVNYWHRDTWIFPALSLLLCLLKKSLWRAASKIYQNPIRLYQPNHISLLICDPFSDLQTMRFSKYAFRDAIQTLPQQILFVQASTHSILY